MPETAFFTVVYPGIETYFRDFADSLCRQTYLEFDLIIFNENNTKINFDSLLPGIEYRTIPVESATPVKIREWGFAYLKRCGYRHAIFGDADDWFEENRVGKSLELLENYDVVINDVDIVTDTDTLIPSYFSHRVANRTPIRTEEILYGNFMGLSATALRLDVLPESTAPEEIIALDWYLFSRILLEKASAVFTNETRTFYRQYADNLVGLKQMTPESLHREIGVKYAHYRALRSYDREYEELMRRFAYLVKIAEDASTLNRLYATIAANKLSYPYWWENTRNGML
jgi:hypothetical protein